MTLVEDTDYTREELVADFGEEDSSPGRRRH